MIKKFLSATLFGFLALGFAGTFVACDDYDDSDLRMRVEAVEGTLADLQAQIESGAMIASVEKGENGIVIKLTNGQTYDVTNGAAGVAGTPGSVVTIGENGNWFIDGVDQGIPARGKDATDPVIEIIDGYWYINGTNSGQTAKGEQGDKGDKGDKGEPGSMAEITINEDGFW